MTALDDYQKFSTDMSGSTQFNSWKRANPKEFDRWSSFDKALKSGGRPTPPSMATKFGNGMVDGGILYLNYPADDPTPPPTPDPSPPTGNWPPALVALYQSFTPASSKTTVTNSSELKAAMSGLSAGKDVLVKSGTYSGQYDIAKRLATGKIVARFTFEQGVVFNAGSGVAAAFNINNCGGILFEGPGVVTNPAWSNVLVNDSNDIIVRGMISHDSAVQGFYQGGDSGGSSNVWFVDCEAYNNGKNTSAWASYPPNYYLAGAHGIYYGGGGAQTRGGGIINCYIHDQHVGYGVQFYGHSDLACIDGCRFVNIDGKVSGGDSNLQVGTVGDRAGVGIEAYGGGITNLTIGKSNTFQNCVYKNINIDGGAQARQL
jgi:hypothetical protein